MKTIITLMLALTVSAGMAQQRTNQDTLNEVFHLKQDTPVLSTANSISAVGFWNPSMSTLYTILDIPAPFNFTSTIPHCYSLRVADIFSVGLPDKKGNTLIYAHRSQLHWLNDTTAVIMPYHGPKKRRIKTWVVGYGKNGNRTLYIPAPPKGTKANPY